MTIRPARTELFHADRQAGRQAGRQTDGQAYIHNVYIEEDLPLQFDCAGTLSCCKDSCWLIGTWFPTLRGPKMFDLALVINGCYQHWTIFGVQKIEVSTMTSTSESTESEIGVYYHYAPPVYTHTHTHTQRLVLPIVGPFSLRDPDTSQCPVHS